MSSQTTTFPSRAWKVIDIDEVTEGRYKLLASPYEHIWEAIRQLAHLPPNKVVTIESMGIPLNIVSKKAHVYAKRYGLIVKARNINGTMYVARRIDETKQV